MHVVHQDLYVVLFHLQARYFWTSYLKISTCMYNYHMIDFFNLQVLVHDYIHHR